jgi:hypothetical protein
MMGHLEETWLGLARVGEGATLEAEELGLEQVLGNGGAIHIDEGAIAAGAFSMNQAREQTFACTGFALKHHGWKAAGPLPMTEELAELGTDLDHSGALAD